MTDQSRDVGDIRIGDLQFDCVGLSEGSVVAVGEGGTSVVFEADPSVEVRGGVRAGAVVVAEFAVEGYTESASAALLVVPGFWVGRVGGVAVALLGPPLVAVVVVVRVVAGPRLARCHGTRVRHESRSEEGFSGG